MELKLFHRQAILLSYAAIVSLWPSIVLAQNITCSRNVECYNKACCSIPEGQILGLCGYGLEHCNEGNGCMSNCDADAKPECGRNAKIPGQKCPLNACCSKRGFCGTTLDFCVREEGCQSNCVPTPPQPSCGNETNIFNRRIAYYESWAVARDCHAYPPERIPAKALTYLYYAYALISEDHEIELGTVDSGTYDLIERTVGLKSKNPALQVYICGYPTV